VCLTTASERRHTSIIESRKIDDGVSKNESVVVDVNDLKVEYKVFSPSFKMVACAMNR